MAAATGGLHSQRVVDARCLAARRQGWTHAAAFLILAFTLQCCTPGALGGSLSGLAKAYDVRVLGPASQAELQVLLQLGSTESSSALAWVSVCSSGMGAREVQTVCRQLRAGDGVVSADGSDSQHEQALNNAVQIECSGWEPSLRLCSLTLLHSGVNSQHQGCSMKARVDCSQLDDAEGTTDGFALVSVQAPVAQSSFQFMGADDTEAGVHMLADPAACSDGVHDDTQQGCVTQLEFDSAKMADMSQPLGPWVALELPSTQLVAGVVLWPSGCCHGAAGPASYSALVGEAGVEAIHRYLRDGDSSIDPETQARMRNAFVPCDMRPIVPVSEHDLPEDDPQQQQQQYKASGSRKGPQKERLPYVQLQYQQHGVHPTVPHPQPHASQRPLQSKPHSQSGSRASRGSAAADQHTHLLVGSAAEAAGSSMLQVAFRRRRLLHHAGGAALHPHSQHAGQGGGSSVHGSGGASRKVLQMPGPFGSRTPVLDVQLSPRELRTAPVRGMCGNVPARTVVVLHAGMDPLAALALYEIEVYGIKQYSAPEQGPPTGDAASGAAARLAGGTPAAVAAGVGRLELYVKGAWGSICLPTQAASGRGASRGSGGGVRGVSVTAQLACASLGYTTGWAIDNTDGRNVMQLAATPIWWQGDMCAAYADGLASPSLAGCVDALLEDPWQANALGVHNCGHDQDMWVQCSNALHGTAAHGGGAAAPHGAAAGAGGSGGAVGASASAAGVVVHDAAVPADDVHLQQNQQQQQGEAVAKPQQRVDAAAQGSSTSSSGPNEPPAKAPPVPVPVTPPASYFSGTPGIYNVGLDSGELEPAHAGLIMVYLHALGNWYSICADGWDAADARVVCQQMGYADGNLPPTSHNRPGARHLASGSGYGRPLSTPSRSVGIGSRSSFSLAHDGAAGGGDDVRHRSRGLAGAGTVPQVQYTLPHTVDELLTYTNALPGLSQLACDPAIAESLSECPARLLIGAGGGEVGQCRTGRVAHITCSGGEEQYEVRMLRRTDASAFSLSAPPLVAGAGPSSGGKGSGMDGRGHSWTFTGLPQVLLPSPLPGAQPGSHWWSSLVLRESTPPSALHALCAVLAGGNLKARGALAPLTRGVRLGREYSPQAVHCSPTSAASAAADGAKGSGSGSASASGSGGDKPGSIRKGQSGAAGDARRRGRTMSSTSTTSSSSGSGGDGKAKWQGQSGKAAGARANNATAAMEYLRRECVFTPLMRSDEVWSDMAADGAVSASVRSEAEGGASARNEASAAGSAAAASGAPASGQAAAGTDAVVLIRYHLSCTV